MACQNTGRVPTRVSRVGRVGWPQVGGKLLRRGARSLLAREHEIADHRIDLRLPARPAEYAVVACTGLEVMLPHVRAQRRAEFVRRERLPDRADVVTLAPSATPSGGSGGFKTLILAVNHFD